ncbi:ankyrin repeat-containing domain protein [Hypoxylon sp. NC1633]|nr:ankyrin repeat-containing domain protein [Hypoxylon sp. NC1633]
MPPATRPPRPEPMIRAAMRAGSMSDLQEALQLARRSEEASKIPSVLATALRTACLRNFVPAVEYLVDVEKASITTLHPGDLSPTDTSVALLDALYTREWNPNQAPRPADKGDMLLDHLCHKDDAVKWLIEHGAPVDRGQFDPDYAIVPQPAPILETCSAVGSLESFKLLHEKGAPISRRTLHKAVYAAASVGADPSALEEEKEEERVSGSSTIETLPGRERRGRVLRYLVDGLRLDINQMDRDIPVTYHYGTPINYAAAQRGGAKVVRWLLDKGANPGIKSLEADQDAAEIARSNGCHEVLEVIQEWKNRQGQPPK